MNPSTVLAGQELTIQGSGFATSLADNRVALVDGLGNEVAAQMTAGTATQLKALVPFGAATGVVRVRTPQGEAVSSAPLNLRTSVSGFIEEAFIQPNGQTGRRPVPNVTVIIQPPVGADIRQRTGADGSFVLADTPTGLNLIRLDTSATALPYPARTLKLNVVANRDNQFPTTIELQSVTPNAQNSLPVPNGAQQGHVGVSINQGTNLFTTFGFPNGCRVTNPPGQTPDRIAISVFNSGRAPAAMPAGYFSSGIAQISPFGAQITPRGILLLPNPDNIPSGVVVKLFRYDQPIQGTPNITLFGSFNEVGTAQVGAPGQIEVFENFAGNGITQTTFYFASPLYPLARISGRVVASDGRPTTRALVQARGQSTFTRGDGTFTLDNVPVIVAGDTVTLEVSYQRPDRIVDRAQRYSIAISANANVALDGDIVLPGRIATTQPLTHAPPRLTVNENQTLDFSFVATSQPTAGQALQVVVSGAAFASVFTAGAGVYTLRLAPGANTAGEYAVFITATNSAGLKYIHSIAVRVRRPPGNAPTVNDLSVATQQGVPVSLTLAGNDPLGRNFLLTPISLPASGATLTGGSGPNDIIYNPRAGFSGVDVFIYRAVIISTGLLGEPSLAYVIVR